MLHAMNGRLMIRDPKREVIEHAAHLRGGHLNIVVVESPAYKQISKAKIRENVKNS